jgi:methionyl-tRNA formyltransferase
VIIVAAYGLLLPASVLAAAPHGALNIHASLLPRWRGAAPIQRALIAGDGETGITIMQMDEGLDTGAMLSQHPLAIRPDDDTGSLHDRLAALGARAIVDALEEIAAGTARRVAQPAQGATYAKKIGKAEAELDWRRPARELDRWIRALRPSPGARTQVRGESIKFWRARCVARSGEPGLVLDSGTDGVLVACGDGALLVTELQRPGGTRLPAGDFLRGFPIRPGDRLGPAR